MVVDFMMILHVWVDGSFEAVFSQLLPTFPLC